MEKRILKLLRGFLFDASGSAGVVALLAALTGAFPHAKGLC